MNCVCPRCKGPADVLPVFPRHRPEAIWVITCMRATCHFPGEIITREQAQAILQADIVA